MSDHHRDRLKCARIGNGVAIGHERLDYLCRLMMLPHGITLESAIISKWRDT